MTNHRDDSLHVSDIEFSITSGPSEEMLFGCLESLHVEMNAAPYSWSVTITCNATGSGLARRVGTRYPHAHVIDNPEPRRFADNHSARVLVNSTWST